MCDAAAKRMDRIHCPIPNSLATLLFGGRWFRCRRTGTRRRWRVWRRCRNSRSRSVIGVDYRLRNVRSWSPEDVQPTLLRRTCVVQQYGKSILLQILHNDRPELLLNLLDRVLHVAAVRSRRVVGVALQLLLLGVDRPGTRALLVVAHGCGRGLELLGQRIDL